MALVIYHDQHGIYLGSCMGLGFWSNIDPCGQSAAATFPDVQSAEEFMATWEDGRPEGVRLVDVPADARGYASIDACVLAGLPPWMDAGTPAGNSPSSPS